MEIELIHKDDYWGKHCVSIHLLERIDERIFKVYTIKDLEKDFVKCVKRKVWREKKKDYCVIGKIAIYFISPDNLCIRTIYRKSKRNVFRAKKFF